MVFTTENKIHYTLRIASAMCFIGHGAFGIITKEVWSNYFAVFGIGHNLSFQMMPILGTIDILMGIILLFYPVRALFMWLVIWGIVTALLRPLSGEPFAEFFERAGNFGAPLALLLLAAGSGNNLKSFMLPIKTDLQIDIKQMALVVLCLRVVVFLLLVGHGLLNLGGKNTLVTAYSYLGFVNPVKAANVVGVLEIIAASLVLIRPKLHFILILFIWKIVSELFYPQHQLFEWIERGGSYGTILALWFALDSRVAVSGISFNKIKKYAVFNKQVFNSNKPVF
jgi:hypothetical protein